MATRRLDGIEPLVAKDLGEDFAHGFRCKEPATDIWERLARPSTLS
jgi:hypothetical protein